MLQLTQLKVTWEVMPDPQIKALPRVTRNRMDAIHRRLHERPVDAINELRELNEKHPGIPCLQNWLIAALGASPSQTDQAEALDRAEQLFRDRPDYFFARTALADLCLGLGEIDRATSLLFDPGTSLAQLYPEREVFHISEIRNWAHSCCRTQLALGNVAAARTFRDLLADLEPDSPSVRRLDQLLDGRGGRLSKLIGSLKKAKERFDHESRDRKASPHDPKPSSDPNQPELF